MSWATQVIGVRVRMTPGMRPLAGWSSNSITGVYNVYAIIRQFIFRYIPWVHRSRTDTAETTTGIFSTTVYFRARFFCRARCDMIFVYQPKIGPFGQTRSENRYNWPYGQACLFVYRYFLYRMVFFRFLSVWEIDWVVANGEKCIN